MRYMGFNILAVFVSFLFLSCLNDPETNKDKVIVAKQNSEDTIYAKSSEQGYFTGNYDSLIKSYRIKNLALKNKKIFPLRQVFLSNSDSALVSTGSDTSLNKKTYNLLSIKTADSIYFKRFIRVKGKDMLVLNFCDNDCNEYSVFEENLVFDKAKCVNLKDIVRAFRIDLNKTNGKNFYLVALLESNVSHSSITNYLDKFLIEEGRGLIAFTIHTEKGLILYKAANW